MQVTERILLKNTEPFVLWRVLERAKLVAFLNSLLYVNTNF